MSTEGVFSRGPPPKGEVGAAVRRQVKVWGEGRSVKRGGVCFALHLLLSLLMPPFRLHAERSRAKVCALSP